MFLALLYNTLCPFLLCSHLDWKERVASFTLIVFLITRDCYCSIAFPHCVCVCGGVGLQCMIVVFPGQTDLLFWLSHATAYTYLKVFFLQRYT